MAKSVHVDVESLPQDAEVEVPGLGVFKNGHTSEVSEEQLATYVALGNELPEGDFECVIHNRESDKSAPSEDQATYDQAADDADEALKETAEFKKQRDEDPNATANIGAPVVLEENTDAADGEDN